MSKYSKADLKALMREKLAAKSNAKIESPLAAYDSKGQLTCRLCLSHVKESSWTTHLVSPEHKESIEKLKKKSGKDDGEETQPAKGIKRPMVDRMVTIPSVPVSIVPVDTPFDTSVPALKDNSSDAVRQTDLPAGFFDDPVRDARERKIVYKDPLEEEWNKFQRVISGESSKADFLVQDELEETQKEKTVEEIDKQLNSWQKIDQLQKKIENIRSIRSQSMKSTKSERIEIKSEDEEEDFDTFLDWRTKRNKK